jgi:hypothetical protein
MTNTQQTAPNPRRKFFLLKAIGATLGPDLTRRELSVAELEAIAAKHSIDISKVPAR